MDEAGLFIVKIARLEDTCVPTALVFNGPPEFGKDCVTFSNDIVRKHNQITNILNKASNLLVFQLVEQAANIFL